MPRPLVFGNGRLLVQLDNAGNVRDLSWPIGIWNHLAGRAIRMAVWVDGTFSWLDGSDWEHTMHYLPSPALTGQEVHNSTNLGIRLEILEWMPSDEDSFQREIKVTNLRDTPRDVRVFFIHDLKMLESDIGDCVLWHPGLGGLVHFKGLCAVLFRVHMDGVTQYACKELAANTNLWRNLEAGELSMNPIAQGTVESALGVGATLEAHGSSVFRYEIALAHSIDELGNGTTGAAQVIHAPHSHFPERPKTVLDKPASKPADFHVAIIKTQIAENGAILAANDSDIMGANRANYSYCWVRDGAHVAESLAPYDGGEAREKFIDWAVPLLERRPYFLQKYRADGTFGASWHPWTREFPIQLDETASFVSLLTQTERNHAAIIQKCASFLLKHQEDNLPMPSYDLWEETWGIHTYTIATVIRALKDTGHGADAMTHALCDRLYHGGYFRRNLTDDRPDASTLFVGLLGILPMSDPRVQSNAEHLRESLWIHGGVGGLARYPGDYYCRQNDRHPGNPWIICTLWLAQHEVMSRRPHRAHELLDWVNRHAHPSGILPEQVHPETGEPLSVSPLTWSHAEYLKTLTLLS